MTGQTCEELYKSIISIPTNEKITAKVAAEWEAEILVCYEQKQITLGQYEAAMAVIKTHNVTPGSQTLGQADFIFRVDSANLTAQQKSKIGAAIQATVLKELAELDLASPTASPDFLYRPISWYGGRVLALDNLVSAVQNPLSVATIR